MARDAITATREVTRAAHRLSFVAELESAAALVTASGIRTDVAVDLGGVSPAIDEMLAWAVREGVTNLLRHSNASHCSMNARVIDGTATLEIINDGVRTGTTAPGSGLLGLTERAAAHGGQAAGGSDRGRYQLAVSSVPMGGSGA